MNRNIKTVLVVSVLVGISGGIYDFIFPYYLDSCGISFEKMGYIFAVSAGVLLFVRIFVGKLADMFGRKIFYTFSILICGVANLLTPFFKSLPYLITVKAVREGSFVVREVIHSVVVFESSRSGFMNWIAKTRGAEFLFQGIGTIFCGSLILLLGYKNSFALTSGLLLISVFIILFFFRETYVEDKTKHAAKLSLFDLPSKLIVLSVMTLIFNAGLSCSHTFIMPLFFAKKFNADPNTVALILAIHRISLGLPMIFMNLFVKKPSKVIYIIFVAIEGIVISVSALIPNLFWSASVWLLHDLIGASVWFPIQSHYIQKYSRENSRAEDTGTVTAFSSIGLIIGPMIAGMLMKYLTIAGFSSTIVISAPYFVSGLIVAVSAMVLFWL